MSLNKFFLGAAILAFFVGLVHSVLGEHLIFRRMRQGGLIPINGGSVIDERHVRILWASWHILTVFGWCIAVILFRLSQAPLDAGSAVLANAIFVAMLLASALVFIGAKARHPGWAGLLGVAILIWFATA